MESNYTQLGEICRNASRRFDFEEHGEVVFVNTGDVDYGRFTNLEKESKVGLPGQAKKAIKRGDILFSEIRPGNGRYALVDFDAEDFVVSTKFMVLEHYNSKVDFNYFYKILTSSIYLNKFQKIAEYRSGTFPQITFDAVSHIEFYTPPLPVQKAIAHILGTLDDKIELNRQMNETLEAMAQALFKSWFVDFDPVLDKALAAGHEIPEPLQQRALKRQQVPDSKKLIHTNPELVKDFPARFVFTEALGWIPEGWSDSTIEASTSLIIDHRGKTPKKLGEDWVSKGIPAISAKNIKNDSLIKPDAIKYVSQELYEKWMKNKLKAGDILLTSEAPMGEMLYLAEPKDFVLSQRLYALRASTDIAPTYLYYWLSSPIAKSDLESRCTGTTVTGIKQSELRKVKVLKPPRKLCYNFHSITNQYKEKQLSNSEEIEHLTKLRDTLLPKLISGELEVPAAEKLIAAVD